MNKVNLLNYSEQQLIDFFAEQGEPSYRARQIIKWVHQCGVSDFQQMTNLTKVLRERLIEMAEVKAPNISKEQISKDGTIKWLLQLETGGAIETVFIPEKDRGTLCVSSQVGCALNCTFCSTAQQGFNRNLALSEIIGQVWLARKRLADSAQKITNVVMMGMGEPLLNYDNVLAALHLMMSDHAYGLSKHRVTVSTSGVVPVMERLAQDSEASLAVSLHAANDALRDILVPINKKYPLKELWKTCAGYFPVDSKRKVTFEYVMLNGVNDSVADAKQLIKFLQYIPSKINLIPFNPFPNTPYTCSSPERIADFQQMLMKAGFNVIVRKTRGQDIDAACGQLAGKVIDRTRRSRVNANHQNQ